MVDDYWESSKKMLADAEFLKSLREFDKDNIPAATIQKIKPYCLGSCTLITLDCLIFLGCIYLLSLVLETSFYLERKKDLQDLTNISIVVKIWPIRPNKRLHLKCYLILGNNESK